MFFLLTKGKSYLIFVNNMNNKKKKSPPKLSIYQTERLMELIEGIIHCCQERVLFQSQKFQLSPAEMRCILLFIKEKYLTVKGLAQQLEVAKSRVTKILEGLLKKNLIQGIEDPEDARVKLFSLTLAGVKKTEEIELFVNDIHFQLLQNMKAKERQSVIHSLELLRASMEVVKERLT